MKVILRIIPRLGRPAEESVDWPASLSGREETSRRLTARFVEAARDLGAWPNVELDPPSPARHMPDEGEVVWQIMVRDARYEPPPRVVSAYAFVPVVGTKLNMDCPVCEGFGVLDTEPVADCPLCREGL